MQPDPQRVADTRAWLSRARIDLRAAEHERSAQPPLTAGIVLHAQQLAEKSLKALLTWHDEPFRKTASAMQVAEEVHQAVLARLPTEARA